MNCADVATCISAAAAVVYTFGTFLLWCTTKRQLKAAQNAMKVAFIQTYLLAKSARTEMRGGILFGTPDEKDLLRKVFPELIDEFDLDKRDQQ